MEQDFPPGSVVLVGGGPGDPGLMTVAGGEAAALRGLRKEIFAAAGTFRLARQHGFSYDRRPILTMAGDGWGHA